MAELSCEGTSTVERTSVARTRPSASRSGKRSVPATGTMASRIRARASSSCRLRWPWTGASQGSTSACRVGVCLAIRDSVSRGRPCRPACVHLRSQQALDAPLLVLVVDVDEAVAPMAQVRLRHAVLAEPAVDLSSAARQVGLQVGAQFAPQQQEHGRRRSPSCATARSAWFATSAR